MTIAKAGILTFVNDNLKRAETSIDVPIQTVLNDLSDHNLLIATDTDQTLTSSSLTLNRPSLFKDLVSIVLINGDSVRQAPLKKLPQGHLEYRRLRDNDSANGQPEWFSDFDSKFWLWRPSNGAYTTEIEYYKFHAQDVDNIEFRDEFTNCINFGVAYFVVPQIRTQQVYQYLGPDVHRGEGNASAIGSPATLYYPLKEAMKDVNKQAVAELEERLREWSLNIKMRDGWICRNCGEIDRQLLHSHHKKPRAQYPKLTYNLENGECVCIACHALKHKDNIMICDHLLARLGVLLYTRLYPEKGKKLAELLK